jgi:hypothetical protein
MSRRVVIDAHGVIKVFVELRIKGRLQDLFQYRQLGFFFRFEGARIFQHFAVAISKNVG